MLVRALEDLAKRAGCQVFLTTHTPTLARRFSQFSLRLVTEDNGQPIIRYGKEEDTLREIVDSLGVLPDHNIRVFLGVEGRNDINFLRTISKILHDAGESVPDLGEAEDSGHLVIIPVCGNNLDLWVSRLKGFNRPEFYLIDRDTTPPIEPHYRTHADEINQRNNCTAWHTSKRELENYIHKDLILSEYRNYAGTGRDFEDVPSLFAQAVHEAATGDTPWAEVLADKEKYRGKISNAKKRLCTEFAARMTPALLNQVDRQDDIRGWLRAIGAALSLDAASGQHETVT